MSKTRKTRLNIISYALALSAAFVAGAAPAALVFGVDPYEIFRGTSRTTQVQDIAEKAHYPLWKIAKYEKGAFDTLVIGDSRARSLRDKYWHELGMERTLNLAYGGGTIPEIYSTFQLIKDDEAIKNLVIGIQLRSFDNEHKDGMNRVPEAKIIVDNKMEYLKNWSVIKTAWKMLSVEQRAAFDSVETFAMTFSMSAKASETQDSQNISTPRISSDFCHNCDLPKELLAISGEGSMKDPFSTKGEIEICASDKLFGAFSAQNWQSVSYLYKTSDRLTSLPKKMASQVVKNARSDWEEFNFSAQYWTYLTEISDWAKAKNVNLIFVIPPTIEDMQRTISIHGLEVLNHRLRVELARLGTVIDFDYSNDITKNITNFSDAYHSNSKISRGIVGEVAAMISGDEELGKRDAIDPDILSCQADKGKAEAIDILNQTHLYEGNSCRVWRKS